MTMFAGLDVGGKRTTMCVVHEAGKVVWRGVVDTHPEMIDAALKRFDGKLAKTGKRAVHAASVPLARGVNWLKIWVLACRR